MVGREQNSHASTPYQNFIVHFNVSLEVIRYQKHVASHVWREAVKDSFDSDRKPTQLEWRDLESPTQEALELLPHLLGGQWWNSHDFGSES